MSASDRCPVIRREKTGIDRIWVWEWQNGDIKYVALVNGHREMWTTEAEAIKSVEEYQATLEARKAEQQSKAACTPTSNRHKKQKNKQAVAPPAEPNPSSAVLPASMHKHTVPQSQQDRSAALHQENEMLAAKVAELKARREAAESFCYAAATACALPSRPRPTPRTQQRNKAQMSVPAQPGRPARRLRKPTADNAAAKEAGQPSSRQRRNFVKNQSEDTATVADNQVSHDVVAQIVADALAVAKKPSKKQAPASKSVKISSAVGSDEHMASAAEHVLKALAGLVVG